MINKNKIFIFILFTVFFPLCTYAADQPLNAGLVSGLWFSKTPFFVGDTVRIYTAFQNQSGLDLNGEIVFYDGQTEIARREFNSINGQLIQNWADWKVTYGDHNIHIKISKTQSSSADTQSQSVELSNGITEDKVVFVDKDTDGDKTGDKVDNDDDNDGISDATEISNGTNPLSIDSDGDSIPDLTDKTPLVKDAPVVVNKNSKDTEGIVPALVSSSTVRILQSIDSSALLIKNKLIEYRESLEEPVASSTTVKNKVVATSTLETVAPSGTSTTSIIASSTSSSSSAVQEKSKKTSVGKPLKNYKASSGGETFLKYVARLFLSFFILILSYEATTYIFILVLLYLLWKIVRWIVSRFL